LDRQIEEQPGLAKRLIEGFPRCYRREGPSALSCAAWRPAASIVADSQAFSPAPKRLQPGARGASGRDRERLIERLSPLPFEPYLNQPPQRLGS
jgi:hypothetical protein